MVNKVLIARKPRSQTLSKSEIDMGRAVELLRKGGAIVNDPCLNCGGLQLKYKERHVCVNCGDLSTTEKAAQVSISDTLLDVRDLVLKKIGESTDHLSEESDPQKQIHLTELILKYLEILDKTRDSAHAEKTV